MSESDNESFFESIFGKGGSFEQVFGKKTAATTESKVARNARKREERTRYQESLMTELLITLAGKGVITNEDAKNVIAKAKERAKQKSENDEKATTDEKAAAKTDDHNGTPCGGSCPIHDKRPHRKLECARCRRATPHLIEGEVARCRICVTSRSAS